MLNQMMDSVIRKFGFESNEAIDFCRICENEESTAIEAILMYYALMNNL